MSTKNSTTSPKYSEYSKVNSPRMGATSPLRKWELIVKKQLGLSRSISHVLLLSVAISLVVILYFLVSGLFLSKPATPQVELDVTPSFTEGETETENTDEKLHNKHTTTIMSMTIGADGQMHSETTTETMGTDANGQVHATRETQTGGQADKEAQEMMGAINNMMGGLLGGFGGGPFGGHGRGGGLLDNLFGQPQPDPFMEALGLGGFGQMHRHAPAHEVFHLRDHHHHHQRRPRQHAGAHIMGLGDLIEAIVEPVPTVEIVEIPTMVIDATHGHHHHHHDHHGHDHGHNHHHGGHTPEIEVVKPNGNQ